MSRIKEFAKVTAQVAFYTLIMGREIDLDDPEELTVNYFEA